MTTRWYNKASPLLYALLCWMAFTLSMGMARPVEAQTISSLPCTPAPSAASFNFGTVFLPASVTVGTLLGSPQQVQITFTCATQNTQSGASATSCASESSKSPEYSAPYLNAIISSNTFCKQPNGQNRPTAPVLIAMPTNSGCGECGLSHFNDIEIQGLTANGPTAATNPTGLLYKTNIGGISLLLITSSTNQGALTGTGGTLVQTSFGNPSLPVTFTAQLEVTGAVTPGSQTTAISLMSFENFTSGSTNSSSTYGSLGSGTFTVQAPACSVNTNSVDMTVKLPDIFTNALTANGSTAGKTPFSIYLQCQFGSTAPTLAITMTTANPQAGATGVVAPSSGGASNVGVQILDGSGNPITFGQAQPQSNIANGTSSPAIPFFAQYYAVGTPIGAGTVSATVTYNLTYP